MGKDLKDYVPVAERIEAAISDIQSVETSPPTMLTETMGYIRARITFADGRFTDGTATFRLDMTGYSAQATSPIEDCETSAVGRALANAGYKVKRGIASREEVAEAQRRAAVPRPEQRPPVLPAQSDARLALEEQLRDAARRLKAAGGTVPKLDLAALSDDDIRAKTQEFEALAQPQKEVTA